MQTPLLIISDAPSSTSGLGRITRDIALRLTEHCSDIFRVACLGYGGPGSRTLPFQQYFIEEMKDWFLPTLPRIWDDWAGKDRGVVLTIWDASRLLWFARHEYCVDRKMSAWLKNPPFEKWGYFPIDAEGPHGGLSCMLKECLTGYDRILAYTGFGWGLIERSLGLDDSQKRGLSHIPHGIDTTIFHPRPKNKARRVFHDVLGFKGPMIHPNEVLIGIVATNQARKDFGLAIQVVAALRKNIPLRLFIQTDTLERYWSIPALLSDYDLLQHTIVNCGEIPDEIMSVIYSACDITLGIGLGEGFGYPIFESLACGTPVVTGDYGGQAEFLNSNMLIKADGRRLEGLYNCYRPTFRLKPWVDRIMDVLKGSRFCKAPAVLPAELDWKNTWLRWEAWFREGHQNLHFQENSQDQTSSIPEKDMEKSDPRILSFDGQESRIDYEDDPVSTLPSPESV